MSKHADDEEKARFIFEQVFLALGLDWAGPEFDFDRDCYKARIQEGMLKGNLVYVSQERLQDRNISAENIKHELLLQLRTELVEKFSTATPGGRELGYWKCIHCGEEHLVLSGGATGCVSVCPTVSAWISVLPSWVYERSREPVREQASQR